MLRRIFGTLLWLLALPVLGTGRLLWISLRVLGKLRPKPLLMLGCLMFALSLPNPVTAQFSAAAVGPLGHQIAWSGLVVTSVLVLACGSRSPALGRIRRSLHAAGW